MVKSLTVHGPARILVLEDDHSLREVLADLLRNEGFEVTAVARGETAVECASREAYDLIIADIRMDGKGGLEALEQTQRLQPGIGSLIVSGYATDEETSRAGRLQVGGYLTKPFKMQELLERVRAQLAERSVDQTSHNDDEFVRRSLGWSLAALAKVVDDTGAVEGSLQSAADAAYGLCQQFHQPPAMCLAARWAAIVMGASSLPGMPWPSALVSPNRQLPELTELLGTLRATPHGEALPTAAQAVGLGLAAHLGRTSPHRDPEELGRALQGRFRGDLIEALLTRLQEESSAPRIAAPQELDLGRAGENPQHRSLASLGYTLERSATSRARARRIRLCWRRPCPPTSSWPACWVCPGWL